MSGGDLYCVSYETLIVWAFLLTNLGDCFDVVSSDGCRFLLKSFGLRLLSQTAQEKQRQ